MVTQLPLPHRDTVPHFRRYLSWPNGWLDQDPSGREVGLSTSDIVLDGDRVPPPHKGGSAPLFFGPFLLWPNGWMHQDVTWYGGMPRPRSHCTRWGTSSPPPKKGAQPPVFSPCMLWPKGWMDHDGTWYEGRLWTGQYCVLDADPAAPPRGTAPPSFRPMSIVATVAHLSYCWALVSKWWLSAILFGLLKTSIWRYLSLCKIWLESMKCSENMEMLIINEFDLKMPIHAQNGGF